MSIYKVGDVVWVRGRGAYTIVNAEWKLFRGWVYTGQHRSVLESFVTFRQKEIKGHFLG